VFLDARELCQLKIIISHPRSQHLVMWNGLKANHFLDWFVPNGVPKQRKMWSDQKIDLSSIRKGGCWGYNKLRPLASQSKTIEILKLENCWRCNNHH
jgi:hypothetical protein